MRSCRFLSLVMSMTFICAAGWGQTAESAQAVPTVSSRDLGKVVRGSKVQVEGAGFPSDPKNINVRFTQSQDPKNIKDVTVQALEVNASHTAFTCQVPKSLAPGKCTVEYLDSQQQYLNPRALMSLEVLFTTFWTSPRFLSFVILIALGLIACLFAARGAKYTIGDRQYGPPQTFFIDKETDTYSLSKFQIYLWTGAAILSYAYLWLSRVQQGHLEMPDIPAGLPGIVAISAATVVGSEVITNTKGGKGAGPIQPSWSDFVTSGGLVVAERMQFFVWTIVGVVGFCAVVLQIDPSTLTVTDFPTIPNGLMALAGISSFGYLGGKFAREPGPAIQQVSATLTPAAGAAPATLTLKIQGQYLSQRATFKIAGAAIPLTSLAGGGPTVADEDKMPNEMAKAMTLNILNPDAAWIAAGQRIILTLTNSDGQFAEKEYTL